MHEVLKAFALTVSDSEIRAFATVALGIVNQQLIHYPCTWQEMAKIKEKMGKIAEANSFEQLLLSYELLRDVKCGNGF